MSDIGVPEDKPDRESFIRTLTRLFNKLTEVKVVTILGESTVTVTKSDSGGTTVDFVPPPGQVDAFVTIVNLLEGDAINIVSDEFVQNQELSDFHAAQVEKSLAVLPGNIEALVKLAKAVIDELDDEE